MTDPPSLSDKQLEIVHDHYKETFARLTSVEASRDRLFLWVLALFALLILEIGYRAAVGSMLGKFSIAGAEISLGTLPLPALLNASWVLTLAITLRYCQAAVFVNRQYPYLHLLENTISSALKAGDVYQRESKFYLNSYPILLDAAWLAYGVVFPLALASAAIGLIAWEFSTSNYPLSNRVVDACSATALVAVLFLYRVYPWLRPASQRWQRSRKPDPQRHEEASTEGGVG